jgi:hypothetical protein
MSYFLSPINSQIVDANGNPLSGGKIYTYQAGTTTATATYTDSTGGTPQANPIILNSLGVPASPIWLNGGTTYKFVIKNSAEVTQRTIDGITGVNDVSSSASEWNESGFVPTYISATQFSVPGDQTLTLHVNRRVRTRNTGGYVYGRISVSAYGGSVTTVTVVNDSGTMDSGLSSVAYGFLSFTPASIPYAMYAAAGANSDITSLSGGNSLLINSATTSKPAIRQTVSSGPVDTNGNSAFGGSTGSTTVTASGTLIATAANGSALGGAVDYTGSILNPSWTGLSTNGTMYLYLDIAAAGTCTTGSTTLLPTYRWGGADVTTSGQFTFNISEMVGKVGNGATAAQTYRVFVGEVTVSGSVVTAITWYALQGRAYVAQTTIAASTTYALTTSIGVKDVDVASYLECKTIDGNYAVGDRIQLILGDGDGSIPPGASIRTIRNTLSLVLGSALKVANISGAGAGLNLTFANWSFGAFVRRAW